MNKYIPVSAGRRIGMRFRMEKQKTSVSEIREAVNPVFNTARSCVTVNALLGDADAQRLMAPLGFDISLFRSAGENLTPEMLEFAAQMRNPGFNIMVETRFAAANRFILESGCGQIVDLPCGYTPRGIKLADSGIRYFGLDLPAVTEAIAPAVKEVIGENDSIGYFAADATNYSSLKEALAEAQGELLITTEGLLMYLTQSELDEVFRGIHLLLENYGGCWITTDNEILAAHKRLMAVLADGETLKPKTDQGKPLSPPENDFLKAGSALQYAEKMGFHVRKIPVFDYLPDSLLSLNNVPAEKRSAVRDTFREMFFWIMTVKENQEKTAAAEERPFSVQSDLSEEKLNIAVSGRLDTITAPELLAEYQAAREKGDIRSVTIDLSSTTYISSAGLRVFLIMRKALNDGGQFHIKNMNKTVEEILNITGFSDLFSFDAGSGFQAG